MADNGADEPAQERAPLVHLLRWRDVTTRCVWLACGREGLNRKDQPPDEMTDADDNTHEFTSRPRLVTCEECKRP